MSKLSAHWETGLLHERTIDIYRSSSAPQAAVIWLHGQDQVSLQGRTVWEEAFQKEDLLVVAPHGSPGWWLDWPTPCWPEETSPISFLTENLVPWIGEQWGITTPCIGLAGIGTGGQGAVNLAFRQARRYPVVAGVAPDIDFHQWHGQGTDLDTMFSSMEAARQQTATLHLHPLNWPRHLLLACDPADAIAWEGTERLASKLVSSGVPFESLFDSQTAGGSEFGGQGPGRHWESFDRMAPAVVGFLGKSLRSVRDSGE